MKPGLEKILLENLHRFHAFAAGRLETPDLAEDVVQESLLKALKAADELVDEEKALAWFYRIMRGTMVDLYRKRSSDRNRDTAWAEDQAIQEAFHGEACRCLHDLVPSLKPEYAELHCQLYFNAGNGAHREPC